MRNLIGVLLLLLTSNVLHAGQYAVLQPFPTDLVDVFVDFESSNPVIAYTVPEGKLFILTDIIGITYGSLSIYENGVTKLIVAVDGSTSHNPPHFNLGSGLTFRSGSQVELKESAAIINGAFWYGHVTITGYLY